MENSTVFVALDEYLDSASDMDKRKADIMLKFENQTMIAEYKEADKDDLKKRLDEYMQIAASMQEGKNGEGNQI